MDLNKEPQFKTTKARNFLAKAQSSQKEPKTFGFF